MQQINYSTRMIVVCVEPTEPYGGISVKGSLESKLCVRLERSGVQSMWLKSYQGTPAGILIGGTNPF